jgi:HD-GYP domain-containing protein (c-di-GMP phosphodiesterase class II)
MSSKRISLSDIQLGQALKWDVYGSDGGLLLRRGFVVSNSNQIEILLQRGLYVGDDNPNDDPHVDAEGRKIFPKMVERPSVVRMISQIRNQVSLLSLNLAEETQAPAKFLSFAKQIMVATYLDADVALGCILLHQEGMYAARHCVDVAVVSILMGKALKKTDEEIIFLAAACLSMNLSMLRQQELLQAKSESLNEEEQQLISTHPAESVRLLKAAGVNDEAWLSWVLHHHENEDGTGYPGKKKSAEIPQNAKIISIADRYCARICTRSYRKSLLPSAALKDILVSGKSTVDLMLVALFIRELGTYPIGTFVKLDNGEIGVVISKGMSATTPYVQVLTDPWGAALPVTIKRDTQRNSHGIREVLHRDQLRVKFSMRRLWGEIAME